MLKPILNKDIPEQTKQVTQVAFPKAPVYDMRDELSPIFDDKTFAHVYPPEGQSALADQEKVGPTTRSPDDRFSRGSGGCQI